MEELRSQIPVLTHPLPRNASLPPSRQINVRHKCQDSGIAILEGIDLADLSFREWFFTPKCFGLVAGSHGSLDRATWHGLRKSATAALTRSRREACDHAVRRGSGLD